MFQRRMLTSVGVAVAVGTATMAGAVPASAATTASISGQVSVAPGLDVDVADIDVIAYRATASGIDSTSDAYVDDDGSFVIDGLAEGVSYQVMVVDDYSRAASGYYRSGSSVVTGDPDRATLVLAGSTGVDVEATAAAAPISGNVVYPPYAPDWAPVEYYLLVDGLGRPVSGAESEVGGRLDLGGTAADGSYRLIALDEDLFDAHGFSGRYFTASDQALAADVSKAAVLPPGTSGIALYIMGFDALSRPVTAESATVGDPMQITRANWSVTWEGDSSFQWLRDGKEIPGATEDVYWVTRADVGARLSVRETRTAAGYASGAVTSRPTSAVVRATPWARSEAVVTGTYKVGHALSASSGLWDVPGGTSTYQWFRGSVAIKGAVGRTYKLVPGDMSNPVYVQETYRVDGYLDASSISDAGTSTFVRAGDAPKLVAAPKVSGSLRVGGSLTVSQARWSLPGVKVTVQWRVTV